MSDDNDLKPSLCTTEDEFERFQSASMYQEDEYITLSDILPPEPKLPDYNDISQIPYDNEVVLSTADDEGASKRNEDDLPSLPIEIPASEVNQDFTKSVQNVANDPITQQPKKRGRKKKTIPENNTSVIGDNDQNTLNSLETNANGIAEQASTTKRGRIIKKPVPYEITPVKTKRGRGRNVSSLNNQSLSAADSTTLDNVASSEPSNPETDETNKQPVLDSIQPGKRRRGRAKKNNSSELNDSSLTHVSISEPQTLENIEIGDTSSNSPKKRGRKRTKLNEMKVEPNSLPDTLDTGIRTNDDLDDIPLLSQVKNIPDGSTETALPDQSHVPIVDSEITLSQNLRSSEPNLNKTLKKPPTKRGRKSRIATIPQKPFDTEIKLEETYDDDETDDLCLSKLKETLDTSDLKIKEHDINIEEHDLVPPNQFDNYEISNGNLGNDISDRNITDHNEIKQESSKQGVSPLKRNTKMPHMSDFEYNIDSIVGSDPNSNENNVDDIDGTSKRRRKAKQMPHNYHEESDEDPFANVELSDDEPKKHRKGTKYYSDDEYVPEMSLKTGKRRKSSDSSDSDMLEDELNDSKRKKMVFKHANRVGEQVDDIEEVLQSSVITASTPSAWGTSSEFENFIAKKIQGTDLKIKKVSESTEHKAPLEIPVLLPEKRMIEMCSQTNIIHTSSVAVQTSSNQEIIIKDNKTLTKEQSVKACEFLNDIVKTTAELGQLMTEKSQDFMKKKIHTDHVTDTIKMDYCVKKSFLLFKLAKHNLMQMEDDLAKQYDTFLKTNNLSSCREKPKVIAAKPKESGDSDCEIVEESPTANKSGKDTKLNPKTVFLNKELSIKIAKKSTTQPPKGAKTTEKKLDIKGRHTVWISDTVMVKKVKPSQSFLAQDSRNKKPPDTFITEQMVSAFFMEYNRQQAFAICAPFVSMDWLNVNNECVCNYFVGQSGDLNNINLSINGTQNITATTTSTSVPNSDNSIMILSNGITSPEPLMTLCYRILNNKLNASKHVEEDPINDVPTDWFKQPATLSQLCLDALNNDHHSVTSLESKSDSAIVIAQIPLSIPPLKTLCYIIVKELFCYVKTSFENISENKTTSEIDDLECFENESYNSDVFDNKCSAHFTKKYCFVETMKENTCTALDAENRIQSLSCMCLNLIQSRKEELSNYSIEISSTQENSSSASPGLDKFEPKSLFSMCVKLIQRKQESYSNQSHGNVNQFNRNIEIVNICRIKSLSSMCLDLIQCKELHLSQEFLEDDNLSQLLEKELFEDKNQLKVHTRYATKNGIKSLFSMCVNQIRNKEIHSCESPLQELTPKTLKCLAFENLKAIFYENWQRPNEPNETVSLCHDTQICNEMPIEGLTINSVNTLSEEAFSNLENIVTDATSDANYEDDFDNDDSNLYEESNPEPDLNTTEEENVHNWVSQVQMKELKSCFNPLAITQEPEGNKATVVNIKTEPVEDPFDNIMDLPAVSSIPTVGINTAVVKTELGPGLDEMTMIPDINQIKPELDSTPADIQRQNSYDGDTFEHFVSSNKMTSTLDEVSNEDIFSQSALRIRRQHEPDLDDENDNIGMSLLIPQTYENMNIETAKGSLMESSSDEGGKNKKSTGKKKVDKKPRGRPKRSEQKVTPNKDAPSTSKERVLPNEVSTLTRKMRERIRQEERQNESSDSDDDNVPLNLRNKKENDKAKSKNSNKAAYPEIQCNSVDSTANVNDQDNIVEKFTGFSSIDQNQTSSYAKLMKYVYDKIIPDENVDKIPEVKVDGTDKSDNGNRRKSKENLETSENSDTPIFAENEPVELLECEPMMPFFDDDLEKTDKTNRSKSIKEKKHSQKSNEPVKYLSHKPTVPVISDNSSKTLKPAKEKKAIPDTKETCANANFVERNGWKCYPVNTNDSKLYQTPSLVLEKLPETFVETYFRYQDITSSKSQDDDEVNRLTNLNTLNRSGKTREKKPHRKGAKGEHTTGKDAEGRSRSASPANSDRYDELTASEDEEAGIDKELPPPVPKHSENILAKDSLMHDNDSDSDGGGKANVKQEHSAESAKSFRPGPRSKTKAGMDPGSLMLTADKMMNKELSLLHAPVSLNEDIETKKSPTKPSNEEEKRRSSQHRSASKHHSSKDNMKNEEDSSSEEEKQWVTTKEKLLKRMGKKEDVSVDDAKRSKLVTDFIERRGDKADSHKKPRGRPVRSRKKFLERQKQLKILSRELFGEPSTDGTHKRSAQAYFKGRRNIRKVIDKKSLARSTVIANMEEFERKKRLNAKQAKLREVMGCEEGVNVLVINDEVCLEYDFEEDRPVVTIHPFFTKVMKAHQYEGVKFMWDACFESLSVMESGHAGGGCILAHCMGLGKTLQVLALLHTVLTHPGVGMRRVLVCCPLSTVLNWVDEIHKWLGPVTNEIKVFELSKLKKTYERAYQLEDWYNGGGIFIIGYELFRSLSTLDPFIDNIRPTIVNKIRTALLDPGPDIIVCDEGHLLKNDCSVLAVAMSRVVTKRRIVLTGTPMQNNLREYYCMVDFVKPNLLGTYSEYSNRFENPIMNGQHRDSSEEDIKLMKARTHILHKVLEGCLQRQEASVLYPYLPKKHEYTVFIPLTKCQWDLYKHYLSSYAKQSKQSILKDFHILHKIWSHPQVLHNFQTKARDQREKIKAEKLEDDLAHEDHEDIKPNETDIWWLDHLDGGTMLDCLESSNKFVVVFRILDECISLGDKMLIFSTSLFCLDALEYFLKKINNWSLGQEYYRLDGSVPAEVRQKWCREFNAENNVKTKLFLVSTRAGCLGLNMTAANRVVIMDTSWNPAHDIQSIFRVYRFGQKKDCFIYRLVAMGTMEQKIYERSVTKQAIACRVVDEQQIDRHYNSADLTELYRFDESGSSVACGVAAGVRDVALLRVACGGALHAVHEHDSLLRGSEPALPEHERRAAWAQFQQEQEHKQIQNSLGVYPPNIKIPLKRIHGHEYAKPPIISHEDVKQEVVSVAPTLAPVEPKSKRGKKVPDQKFAENVCKSMIPDKPTPVATRSTRGRPLEEVPPLTWGYGIKKKVGRKKKDPKAGTSKQAHLESIRQPVDNNIDEDAMVQQITQILVHHNFQNRGMEIANLIANVKNLVTKGEYNDAKETDELTRSIARVLMGKGRPMLQPRTVTDIMCESITNTAISSAEPEEITGDLPSPPVLIEQERPKANKNNQKLRGTGEMVRVTSGPKSKTKRKAAVEARKSIEILPQDDVINLDDDDSEDSDFETDELVETVTTPNSSVKIKTEPNKDRKTANETSINIDDTNKQPVKKYTRNPKPIISVVKTEKIVDSVKEVSKNKDEESSILLSDDDEPPISQPTPKGPATVIDEPEVDDNEEVPLPLSLLTNKNFIKIVAHTYSTGNPMLDEDAATLAAQYSTFRALKEAEQSGKPIVSGPIYDIATQILGKPILKKLQTVNVKKPPESTATVHQLQDNINAIEAFIKSEPGTSKEKMDKKEQSVKPPTVSAPNNVVPVGLIKRVQSGQNAPIPPQPSPAPARDECILPDDDECIVSDSPPRAPDPPPMVPAPRPMAPGPRPMAPAPRPTPRPSIIVRRARTIAPRPSASDPPPVVLNNYLTRNPRPRIFYTTPTASAAASVVAAVASALPQQKNVIKISQGRVGRPPLAPAPASTPPLSTASNSATICLDSDDEDIPPVALGPVPVALHAGPVPVSLVSAQTGARLPLPPMLAPKNPPRTVTSKANKFVLVPTSQLPVPTVQPEKPPELPKLPSQGTKTKARCKPGDLFRISNTGEIEVITQQQLKEEQLKEEQATRNDNTPKLVPIAPKPSTFTHKAKSKPRILKPPLAKVAQTPAQAPAPTEPRLPKPPEPKLSNPATTPSPAVKPSRSRTISSSSSSNSSRSSSPENPLSILKDVVHIQAAEEKPRISRQKPLLMKTSKAPEANVSVQHVISLDDKPTGSSSSKNNRSVIHMSDSAPPPKSKAEDRTFDKLVYSLKTDKSKPTKPAKGPTKIVGTMKNIILESGKGLTLTGTSSKPSTSQNKKIKAIVTTPKAPETKKRPAVTADSSSIKKARKEPMTLKDFNIDDIDDIIELE